MFLDKFGLCWHGDLLLLRIPSSTTTTTNGLLSTISYISTTSKCGFSIFSYLILTILLPLLALQCHSSSHPIQITIYQKTRRTLSTKRKGLNTWVVLQERELCIIYMKEETPPFSKPLPDRIPRQRQWIYCSCSLSNCSLLHWPVR